MKNIFLVTISGFVGSGFWIIEGFGWVRSSVLVYKPGFRRVQISVFPDLGLGSACFWPNRFKSLALWKGSNGFKVQF